MDVINAYMKYVYVLLGIVLFITVIALLVRLGRLMKRLAETGEMTAGIGDNLKASKEKIDSIRSTAGSFTFFMSLFVILTILREAFRYRGRNDSFGKALTRSCVRHSAQLSRIRF